MGVFLDRLRGYKKTAGYFLVAHALCKQIDNFLLTILQAADGQLTLRRVSVRFRKLKII